MRRIVVKKSYNLTASERKSCYAMSYKSNGDLSSWLHWSLRYKRNDDVVLVKEDGVVLGWGMRTESGDTGFWTKRKYRQQGIGTAMVRRLSKVGEIRTYPHDSRSAALFLKTKTIKDPMQQMIWEREARKIKR